MEIATILLLIIILAFNIYYLINLSKNNSKNNLDNKLNDIIHLIQQNEKFIDKLESSTKDEFARNREETLKHSKFNRDELSASFRHFNETVTEHLKTMTKSNEEKMDKLRDDNNQKLEKIRLTVDEKLHKTLEERLGQSFKLVSDKLEQVHKGLGEMQDLASGVGDLKKVLSNVKTRGILGEIQLGNILEQIMSPEQYETNVSTKHGSRDHVEFAIKLPGKDDLIDKVWLPIDAKFPLNIYQDLIDAYDTGDLIKVEAVSKILESSILANAKEIHTKYIDPPYTTDFGILFLPIEGLYAEVVRRPGLLEKLQNNFKIMITGPTTLAALLNSLQMGFKTLVIEKRSSEVWQVLSAIKTEFVKFGDVLQKTQHKINQASSDLDDLVGKRSRAIQRKLKNIEELPEKESNNILEDL